MPQRGHDETLPPYDPTSPSAERSSVRSQEPGWSKLVQCDGRRGAWCRVTGSVLELCGGREGDDHYLRLELARLPTKEEVRELANLFLTVDWAAGVEAVETRSSSTFRPEDRPIPSSELVGVLADRVRRLMRLYRVMCDATGHDFQGQKPRRPDGRRCGLCGMRAGENVEELTAELPILRDEMDGLVLEAIRDLGGRSAEDRARRALAVIAGGGLPLEEVRAYARDALGASDPTEPTEVGRP